MSLTKDQAKALLAVIDAKIETNNCRRDWDGGLSEHIREGQCIDELMALCEGPEE